MTSVVRLVLAILLVPGGATLDDQEPPPPSDKQIKAMVDGLASPNPKPITGDEDKNVAPEYRLPAGFDMGKQEAVRKSIEGLRKAGPRAFPALIEHWGDDRYCVTGFHRLSEYSHNRTVGNISEKTIFDQLQPYSFWPKTEEEPRGKPKRPDYPSHFLGSKKEALAWWEKHKGMTLFEMQLEALDWVIAEEARHPNDYSDEEKQFLRDVRAHLVKVRIPMQPGNYDWEEVEF